MIEHIILQGFGSCKNLTISTDKCVGPSSSPTSQLKIRVPMQVSSIVYQSNIPTEIELNRNVKKRHPNGTNQCYFYVTCKFGIPS